jgi:uncharacterized Fe-S center protein
MSTVHFMPLSEGEDPSSIAKKTKALYDTCGVGGLFEKRDIVAVKTHFGESDNSTFLHPLIVKAVIDKLKSGGVNPFLTETSTLYRGDRSNALDHHRLAVKHGFGIDRMGVPIVMADGLYGDAETAVEIGGSHYSSVTVARDVAHVQGLVMLNHFKGHMLCGFGGALKNLGMGLASRRGKLRQHSVMTPEIRREACTACGTCIAWCPQDTISMVDGRAFIHQERCIGCGECYAVCTFGAVRIDFGRQGEDLQELMAEHAAGVVKAVGGDRVFHFNYLMNITRNCDCMNGGSRVSTDIGIVAGGDAVAVDAASRDLFLDRNGKSIAQASGHGVDEVAQLRHAESVGMGSMEYEMVEVSP